MSVKETGWADLKWFQLANSRDKWRAFATKGMNISVLQFLLVGNGPGRTETPLRPCIYFAVRVQ